MSGTDRGLLVPAIIGLAVCAFGLGCYTGLAGAYRPQRYATYQEASVSAPTTMEARQPCVAPRTRADWELCANWRASDAAEQSAQWAWWQMLFSLAGVIGLCLTLWFNKRAIDPALEGGEDTDRAIAESARAANAMDHAARAMRAVATWTKQANEVARDAAEAAQRAWIAIDKPSNPRFIMHGKAPILFTEITYRNVGKSPAVSITTFAHMAFGPNVQQHIDAAIDQIRTGLIDWTTNNLFHGDEDERRTTCERLGEDPTGPVQVTFFVIAAYRTVFSDTLRYTVHAFDLRDARRDDDHVDFEHWPYGDNLVLTDCSEFSGYAV